MDDLRFLTVRQPWASLIASGRKTIELRSWDTRYRGDIVIVSGKAMDPNTEWPDGPRGYTLCVVRLIATRRARDDDSAAACCDVAPTDYAWELSDARVLQQVPRRGALGLTRGILSEIGG